MANALDDRALSDRAGAVIRAWRSAERRRVVIKLGTRLLTGGTGRVLPERIQAVSDLVASHRETETVLVTSGAVAAGCEPFGLAASPKKIEHRQAAAAVGQMRLMRLYAEHFAAHGIEVAQLLLTNDCLRDRTRYVNVRNTMHELFGAGVVPIVNENDTVSVDEIGIGDNDNLAAHTAVLCEAGLLVLLTDVDGVHDAPPDRDARARRIPWAATAEALRPYCFSKTARESTGGMTTKLEAAEKAAGFGIPTVIASGHELEGAAAIYEGRAVGTVIPGASRRRQALNHWMLVQKKLTGGLVVDDGALRALRGGASLLPPGVVEVRGRFGAGELVSISDQDGVERARGIVGFADREVDRIKGCHSSRMPALLGVDGPEVIVRSDKLVMLEEGA